MHVADDRLRGFSGVNRRGNVKVEKVPRQIARARISACGQKC